MEIIPYEETFGQVRFQEGYEAMLAGLTIEEQVRCFALTEYEFLTDVPCAELEERILLKTYYQERTHSVSPQWPVIVRDGIVVGFLHRSSGRPLLPYQSYIYDYTSDNNGAGYKERYWYKHLICLPCDHKLW